jgi:hypothetical protein
MMIDMTGGIFSDLSLAFRDGFSITASITYSLVVVSILTVSALFSAFSVSAVGPGRPNPYSCADS